jgi:hypothetical protein
MLYIKTIGLNCNPSEFDGKNVLGIEVTVPEFADKCNLGNLDHHGENCDDNTPSACEQALNIPICKIPMGSTLFTIKPDLDSVTAMAVIISRVSGRPVDTDLVIKAGELDRLGSRFKNKDYRLIAMAKKASDNSINLEDRVRWIQHLFENKIPKNEIKKVIEARMAEYDEAMNEGSDNIKLFGRNNEIALVISTRRWAMGRGYEKAPVVVAYNPEYVLPDNSGTIERYSVGQRYGYSKLNMKSFISEISQYEEGWNGRTNIVGSPQYKSSKLSPMEVVEIVNRNIIRN